MGSVNLFSFLKRRTVFARASSATVIAALVVSMFPAGFAFAATSGPNNAGSGTNIAGIGTIAWTGGGNILTDNTSYATAALASGAISNYMYATSYGFSLPSNAVVDGISVTIGRFSNSTTGGDSIDDEVVSLLKNGTIVGDNKATATDWGTNANDTASYGSTSDLWGSTWTYSDINNGNFGVAFAADAEGSATRTASLDYIQVTVTYHLTYSITTASGAGGTLSPSTLSVTSGANQTFTITPSAGNIVADVSVDSVSQGRVNTYTFTNVTADHSISATFDNGWSQPSDTDNTAGVTNSTNAFTSNDSDAQFDSSSDVTDYDDFSIPVIAPGTTINGIEVALEGSRTSGRTLDVSLTWDEGTTWTSVKNVSAFTATDKTLIAGGSADTWGRTWAPAEFTNSAFKVRVDATSGGGDVDLDQIQVKVYYVTDTIAPTVTINQAGGQNDPTNDSAVDFTVVFSESVADFATGDVTLGGTAGATTAVVTGSGTTYNVAVSGMTGDGTVTASIAAGAANDAAGNDNLASTATDNTVTYDGTAPTISGLTNDTTPTPSKTWNWSSNDGAATYRYVIDQNLSGTPSGSYGLDVTASQVGGNGTYYIHVQARDTVGNESAVTTVSAVLDSTAPIPVITLNGASNPTNLANIPIKVIFSEDVTGFDETDVTPIAGATITSGSFTAVNGNTYTFTVAPSADPATISIDVQANKATDAAGNNNIGTSSPLVFQYDGTAPSATITSGPGILPQGSYTNDTTPDFTFDISIGATAECSQDGFAFASCLSPFSFTPAFADNGSADGAKSFWVRATDGALNVSTSSVGFTLDTIDPKPTITGSPIIFGWASTTPTISINFSEGVTGFDLGDIAVTGGTSAGFASTTNAAYSFTLAPTAQGPVTVSVAADVANEGNGSGNTNASTSTFEFVFDSIDPVFTFTNGPSDGSATSSETVTFEYTVFDANSPLAISCSFDAGSVMTGGSCESPKTFPGLLEGTHTFWIEAVDPAGNVGSTTISFFMSTTSPLLAEVTPVSTPTQDDTPDYTFSSTEEGTITYGGSCSSATTNAVVGNNTITFNSLAVGAYTDCTITVTDVASNVSNLLDVSGFTIEAPPAPPTPTPSSGGGGNGPIAGSLPGGGGGNGSGGAPTGNTTALPGGDGSLGNDGSTGGTVAGAGTSNTGGTGSTGSPQAGSGQGGTGGTGGTTGGTDTGSGETANEGGTDNGAQTAAAAGAFGNLANWWWVILLILAILGAGWWSYQRYFQTK